MPVYQRYSNDPFRHYHEMMIKSLQSFDYTCIYGPKYIELIAGLKTNPYDNTIFSLYATTNLLKVPLTLSHYTLHDTFVSEQICGQPSSHFLDTIISSYSIRSIRECHTNHSCNLYKLTNRICRQICIHLSIWSGDCCASDPRPQATRCSSIESV